MLHISSSVETYIRKNQSQERAGDNRLARPPQTLARHFEQVPAHPQVHWRQVGVLPGLQWGRLQVHPRLWKTRHRLHSQCLRRVQQSRKSTDRRQRTQNQVHQVQQNWQQHILVRRLGLELVHLGWESRRYCAEMGRLSNRRVWLDRHFKQRQVHLGLWPQQNQNLRRTDEKRRLPFRQFWPERRQNLTS